MLEPKKSSWEKLRELPWVISDPPDYIMKTPPRLPRLSEIGIIISDPPDYIMKTPPRLPRLSEIGMYHFNLRLFPQENEVVLEILKEVGEKGLTPVELSKELKVSRSLSIKYLEELKRKGYVSYTIEDSTKRYRITESGYVKIEELLRNKKTPEFI